MIKSIILGTILLCSQILFAQAEEQVVPIADSCMIVSEAEYFASNKTECIGTYYSVKVDCQIRSYEFIIFNRWGEMMFETTDNGEFWDAAMAPAGTYVWLLRGEMDDERGVSKKVKSSGYFNVFR